MNRFVLDCSVTMAWCFEDEADAYTDSVLEALTGGEALAPCIWLLEVANVLAVAERRKRLTPAQSTRFVELLQSLPVAVEDESGRRPVAEILTLARELTLSAYDASYLDLAARAGLPLAMLDGGLATAAARYGVPRFQPS